MGGRTAAARPCPVRVEPRPTVTTLLRLDDSQRVRRADAVAAEGRLEPRSDAPCPSMPYDLLLSHTPASHAYQRQPAQETQARLTSSLLFCLFLVSVKLPSALVAAVLALRLLCE